MKILATIALSLFLGGCAIPSTLQTALLLFGGKAIELVEEAYVGDQTRIARSLDQEERDTNQGVTDCQEKVRELAKTVDEVVSGHTKCLQMGQEFRPMSTWAERRLDALKDDIETTPLPANRYLLIPDDASP